MSYHNLIVYKHSYEFQIEDIIKYFPNLRTLVITERLLSPAIIFKIHELCDKIEYFYAHLGNEDKEIMMAIQSKFAQKLKIFFTGDLYYYLDELQHFQNLTELYLYDLKFDELIPFLDNFKSTNCKLLLKLKMKDLSSSKFESAFKLQKIYGLNCDDVNIDEDDPQYPFGYDDPEYPFGYDGQFFKKLINLKHLALPFPREKNFFKTFINLESLDVSLNFGEFDKLFAAIPYLKKLQLFTFENRDKKDFECGNINKLLILCTVHCQNINSLIIRSHSLDSNFELLSDLFKLLREHKKLRFLCLDLCDPKNNRNFKLLTSKKKLRRSNIFTYDTKLNDHLKLLNAIKSL